MAAHVLWPGHTGYRPAAALAELDRKRLAAPGSRKDRAADPAWRRSPVGDAADPAGAKRLGRADITDRGTTRSNQPPTQPGPALSKSQEHTSELQSLIRNS